MNIFCEFSPSFKVLSTREELFGPSPAEVKANIWNSYSVYLTSPVKSLVLVAPLLIVVTFARPRKLFLFKNNLNPVMIPFLEPTGGNCQDTLTIVEVTAVTVTLLGGCDGTAIEIMKHLLYNECMVLTSENLKLILQVPA